MQRAGQGGGILAPSLGVITKSETKAEDGGQTPQEFSEPSSLVPEFYKVPVASDPGPEGGLKATDLAWTLSTCLSPRSFIRSVHSAFPRSLISLSRAGGLFLLQVLTAPTEALTHERAEMSLLQFRQRLPLAKSPADPWPFPLHRAMEGSEIKDSIFMCENPHY